MTSRILFAEDDDDHAELVKRTLFEYVAEECVVHVRDGSAALDYMHQRAGYENAPKPDVILLDLRMPRVSGLDVLRSIKRSEGLKRIPVVILTTSEAEPDIQTAYELGANSYLVKPFSFSDFDELIRDLGIYWLKRNQSSNSRF